MKKKNATISLLEKTNIHNIKKRKSVSSPFSEQYSANFKKHEPEIIRARQINAAIKEILVD